MVIDQDEVWRFTVAMYGRDGVAKLCLELQERCGLDVNMLLFMFFLGQKGLAPHSVCSLEESVRDWRDNVIIPLRQTRRFMRDDPRPDVQELRQKVKSDELQAEQIEQHILCDAVEPISSEDPFSAARAYLSPNRFDLEQDDCDQAVSRLIAMMGLLSAP